MQEQKQGGEVGVWSKPKSAIKHPPVQLACTGVDRAGQPLGTAGGPINSYI